ncbi:hypothetical protein J6590_101620, partial [Homalodisca vitripennis]
ITCLVIFDRDIFWRQHKTHTQSQSSLHVFGRNMLQRKYNLDFADTRRQNRTN